MVGALIVYNDKILGEGFTSPYGGPHAEVNAINAVTDKSLLEKSTLYVTLEPCSHYGKTPPCSDLIISHNIPQVVIGCKDDNPQVAGKGIAKLQSAGCNVISGILEKACRAHHKRFFTFHTKKRPYIILKWAETIDGYIAPKYRNKQEPVWITNTYSRQLVHKWRAEEQAILVGTNTVLMDNPSLTVREWTGRNPIRIVLDKDKELDTAYNIFGEDSATIICHDTPVEFPKTDPSPKVSATHKPLNRDCTTTHIKLNWYLKHTIAKQICDALYYFQINSLLIEGGAKTLQMFINENLWDEARVFVGNVAFEEGIKRPKLIGKLISEEKIKLDTLKIYRRD
jgi:diaminohydroxyphosphoribosylaminopyrimidine deaminase/5-amino-6-(5-phosphoribosylamino)uracil reductase